MFKYGCGHYDSPANIKDTEEEVHNYVDWVETVGLNGTKKICFECYCQQSSGGTK